MLRVASRATLSSMVEAIRGLAADPAALPLVLLATGAALFWARQRRWRRERDYLDAEAGTGNGTTDWDEVMARRRR